jgi:hypothetical protein
MKIKGLKSTVKQVTFKGDKHPSTGIVSTFTWQRFAHHLAKRNQSEVSSIRIDKDGLTVFWEDGKVLGMTPEL